MPAIPDTTLQRADLRLDPEWIIPIQPAGLTLQQHSVLIRDGRIAALLPRADAEALWRADVVQALPGQVLMPGLVNLHCHAAMSLMRGLADDLPLMTWLQQHIWPAEGRHVSDAFVFDGSLLACAEMLRAGVTCFNDMYFFPEATARAARAVGMRAAIGLIVMDFPTPYASDPEDYLAKGLAMRDAMRDSSSEDSLLSFCMAPHAPYTVGNKSFERIVTLAEELELPIHLHLHETTEEIATSLQQHGLRPLARMQSLGVLGPRLIAVHAVHLTPQEIDLLARHGASVAHCPSSNLKLASGFAPVAAMLEAGVNLGLGTDGAASNNRLDLLGEMRTASLLAKAVANRADALPAHAALHAATLAGARALGLESEIGSIEVGKAADLIAIDLSPDGHQPALRPLYQPASQLVYAAGREHVSHVWVAGQALMQARDLLPGAFSDLNSRVDLWQNRLVAEFD